MDLFKLLRLRIRKEFMKRQPPSIAELIKKCSSSGPVHDL